MPEHVGDGVLGVSDEHHRRLGPERLDAAREAFVGHIVLHDVDERLVDPLLSAGELVEGHDVPISNEANLARGIVHEELWDRHLAAGNQDAVWREL